MASDRFFPNMFLNQEHIHMKISAGYPIQVKDFKTQQMKISKQANFSNIRNKLRFTAGHLWHLVCRPSAIFFTRGTTFETSCLQSCTSCLFRTDQLWMKRICSQGIIPFLLDYTLFTRVAKKKKTIFTRVASTKFALPWSFSRYWWVQSREPM